LNPKSPPTWDVFLNQLEYAIGINNSPVPVVCTCEFFVYGTVVKSQVTSHNVWRLCSATPTTDYEDSWIPNLFELRKPSDNIAVPCTTTDHGNASDQPKLTVTSEGIFSIPDDGGALSAVGIAVGVEYSGILANGAYQYKKVKCQIESGFADTDPTITLGGVATTPDTFSSAINGWDTMTFNSLGLSQIAMPLFSIKVPLGATWIETYGNKIPNISLLEGGAVLMNRSYEGAGAALVIDAVATGLEIASGHFESVAAQAVDYLINGSWVGTLSYPILGWPMPVSLSA